MKCQARLGKIRLDWDFSDSASMPLKKKKKKKKITCVVVPCERKLRWFLKRRNEV